MIVRNINSATRGGTALSLSLDGPLLPLMRELFDKAEIPESIAARFLAPQTGVIRCDQGIHQVGFALLSGDDRLVVYGNRLDDAVTFAALCEGNPTGSRPRDLNVAKVLGELADPWRDGSARALPVLHVFSQHRIWDGYLQAATLGISEEALGTRELAYELVPGKTVVDPRVLIGKRFSMVPPGPDAMEGAHIVQALAEMRQTPAIGEYAAAELPPRHADPDALFVSLELERTQWVEQGRAIAAFLNRAHRVGLGFPRVLVNGMTAPYDGRPEAFFETIEEVEREVVAWIAEEVVYPATFETMHGRTFAEKVEAVRGVRFAIAPISSASLIVNLMGVPCVTYSNQARAEFMSWSDAPTTARLPAEIIKDRIDVSGYGRALENQVHPRVSYSILPKDFVPFAMRHMRRSGAIPEGAVERAPTG